MICAVFLTAALAAPAPAPTPACFETVYFSVRARWFGKADHEKATADMKLAGDYGWELVAVAPETDSTGCVDYHRLYYQRRIPCKPQPTPKQ